jgi:thiamine pyrophosphokinase
VVVLTGGDAALPEQAQLLPAGAYVIAADSGLAQARILGVHVDLAVGDFDSVRPEALAAAERAGCRIERHPPAKDHTDLELGLWAARERGAEQVVVVGGHGGRLDHLLANALLLGGDVTSGMEVSALMGQARVDVVRPGPGRVLPGGPGQVLTLLALGGPALGVSTAGLRYPLEDEDLHPGSTRGVSNELTGDEAEVWLRGGTLLVIRPGPAPSGPLAGTTEGRSDYERRARISGAGAPGPPCAPGR